jgi:hypothetical protein
MIRDRAHMAFKLGSTANVRGHGITVLIVSTPFELHDSTKGFVVVPLISSRERGFKTTPEDLRVQVAAHADPWFAALWAFGPALEEDLDPPTLTLTAQEGLAVISAYDDYLADRSPRFLNRLGKRVRWWQRRSVARFRQIYRNAWAPVGQRARAKAEGKKLPPLQKEWFADLYAALEIQSLLVQYHGLSHRFDNPDASVSVFSLEDVAEMYDIVGTIHPHPKLADPIYFEEWDELIDPAFEAPIFPPELVTRRLLASVSGATTGEYSRLAMVAGCK